MTDKITCCEEGKQELFIDNNNNICMCQIEEAPVITYCPFCGYDYGQYKWVKKMKVSSCCKAKINYGLGKIGKPIRCEKCDNICEEVIK